MKRYFASVLMSSVLLCAPARAETIFEALGEAYSSNPDLQAQRAYLRAVDENVAIAKSGFRPTIDLTGGYSDIRNNNDSDNTDDGSRASSIGAKITQPLFNGLSTYNSVKAADSNVRAEQYNLSNYEQSVFLSASEAYLNVVRDAAIVDLQKNNEKLLKKRLDETVERFNVGEVTRTDVSQAQARYSQAKADRIASEGNLQASKAVYTRVIGEAPKDLSEPENLGDFIPASFQEALEYTKANNYSIRYARELLNSRVYDVAANTGALLPSVTLDGSATTSKSDSSGSAYGAYNRDTKVDEVQWGVNMNIPLYTAGETRAKIRQSKYQKWQAQELVLEAERQAVSDVTSAWELMTSNKAQIKSIKDQVKANEIALDGVQKEEALGNRTILDVLDAYQELLNSNVNEVKARRDYYVAAMQLLLSMGKLTAEDLRLNVDLYNPKKFYKETRDKWLSLSVD